MFERILVPLDGSPDSEAVLPYVEKLASNMKAEVTLVQALTPDYGVASEKQLAQLEAIRTSAKTYVEKVAARLRKKGIATTTLLGEAVLDPSVVARDIIANADKVGADLIAMSAGGSTRIDQYGEAPGSIAQQILRSGKKDLLLVRPDGSTRLR